MADWGDATGVAPMDADPNAYSGIGVVPPVTNPSSPILSPTAKTAFDKVAAYGIPGLGAGLIDTMGTSLGVLSDNSVQNALKTVLPGDGGFSDFYSKNRAPLRAGGEIIGLAIPGTVALKVLKGARIAREAGMVGSFLKNSAAAEALLGSSSELTALEANVGKAAFNATQDMGVFAGRSFVTPELMQAKKAYYTARVVDSVRNTVAFEAGYRTLYNNSEVFFPADYTLSDQLKWGALGLVGGAGMDYALGRYAVRKLVQAQGARAALDNFNGVTGLAKDAAGVLFRPGDRGAGLSQFAAMQSSIKNIIDTSASVTLGLNLKGDTNVINNVLSKNLRDLGTDPHPILPRAALDDDQVQLGLKALAKNQTSFLFATKLGNLPEDQGAFYANLNKVKDDAQRDFTVASFQANGLQGKSPLQATNLLDGALTDYNRTLDAANEIHYVIENDGRFNVYANRAPNWLDTNSFSDIKRVSYQEPSTQIDPATGKFINQQRSKLTIGGDTPLTLHDNFRLELPGVGEDAIIRTPNLSQPGYSALYAATSKMIQDWKPAVGQRFVLNENIPWRQTESTLALANAHPEAEKLIDYTGAFSNAKDAMFHVIDQKYKEFSSLMDRVERPPITTGALAARTKVTPADVFQRLNMPDPLILQAHPMTNVFAAARLEGQSSIADMFVSPTTSLAPQLDHPLDLFRAAMKESVEGDLEPHAMVTVGPLMTQNDTTPLFVSAKSTPTLSYNDAKIHAMLETRRDLQLARLGEIDPETAPLVSGVANKIVGTPASNAARDVQLLHEGTLSGHGVVVPQDRINEQSATLKAAQLIQQDTDKVIDNHVAALSAPALTPAVGALLKPNNKSLLFDFNRVEQAYRHGWDIKRIEKAPNGGMQFILNDSDMNNKLLGKFFGEADVPETSKGIMPDMSVAAQKQGYIPLTVSPEAAVAAQEISKMSIQSGVENNALRVALGQRPIKLRDFHLPTPSLFSDGTYFIRNSMGDVISTYTGGAASDNRRRAITDAEALIKNTGEAHTVASMDEVQNEHSLFDTNFFNVINYADQLAKSGAGIKGGLAHTTIDTGPQTLQNMVKSLHQQFLNVGVRTRAAVFEPELNYAKQASQVTGVSSMNEGNIFDRYQAIMFSRSTVTANSPLNRVYGAIEEYGDRALSWIYANQALLSAKTPQAESGAKGLKALVMRQSTENQIQQFKSALGDFSPFEETQDFLDSTYRQSTQPTVRSLAAKLSLVSSTMSMRFLDVGTAINNLLGVATTMPAVVTALRKLPGEDMDTWLARTGAWGSQFKEGIMTFSPSKAMANATRSYWNGELNEPLAQAAKLGYFEPEYAALAKVLSNPQSGGKGQFEKWVDHASYLADSSEKLSRQMAWGVGYKIGKDLHQFEDDRSTFLFANNFVNDMIGNYNPKNKPAMFQGAVGLPLGAFQTWMFNFYRRMYGYIERGDVRSTAIQYAAQASMFGSRSVPGWGAWNAIMNQSENGADDTESRIERKFPPGVRELILNGSLAGIPAIFGQDSPAFYTRGSVDFTSPPPTLLDASKAPPIQFLVDVAQGVKATIDNIMGPGGFSTQQQEEILANFSTNRALKSIMELAANAKTDKRGNVIEMGTRDAIHVASALMGATPSSTRHLQEAYAQQQAVELTQSDLRAKLNDKTRALMRGGSFDTSDLQDLAQAYVKSGGNPGYFGEWLRNTEAAATTEKSQAKMQELAKSGKWLEFMNMMTTMQQH